MTNLFISYRRDDAAGHAGRLSDRLIARFGAARIFMDVQDIQPGQNFEQAIERTLATCDTMLVVLGPRWLESLRVRIASGEDFVRREIAVSLERGTTVIPVLVGGARMPTAEQLPKELSAFSRCQAVEVRDDRFDEDAARLVDFLAGGAGAPDAHAGVAVRLDARSPRVLGAAAAALVLAVVAGWVMWPSRPANVIAPGNTQGGTSVETTAATVAPPDISGDWIAELQKPGQAMFRIRMTFSRAGEQVIGTVRYPTGEGAIVDGRYVDGRITFHTVHVPQFESEPATIRFQVRVDGDVLRVTTADDGGVTTGLARRAAPPRALPALAYGTWTLRDARDEEGKNWSNSVLQFTAQEESPDGLTLRGRFTWRLDNTLIGREEVTGRYVERTRQVILEGSAVTDLPHAGPERLAVGSYSAVVAPDERALLRGRWGSTAHNEPGFAGEWEAVR
jgi:hypothetical protein